jgi:hypothetical protein
MVGLPQRSLTYPALDLDPEVQAEQSQFDAKGSGSQGSKGGAQ